MGISPVWLILLREAHRCLHKAETPFKHLQTVQLAMRKIYTSWWGRALKILSLASQWHKLFWLCLI